MPIVSFIKSYETGVSESFISRHKIFIEVFRAVGFALCNSVDLSALLAADMSNYIDI